MHYLPNDPLKRAYRVSARIGEKAKVGTLTFHSLASPQGSENPCEPRRWVSATMARPRNSCIGFARLLVNDNKIHTGWRGEGNYW
jgi:hypothetical protein